jgi:hypothetical protein
MSLATTPPMDDRRVDEADRPIPARQPLHPMAHDLSQLDLWDGLQYPADEPQMQWAPDPRDRERSARIACVVIIIVCLASMAVMLGALH